MSAKDDLVRALFHNPSFDASLVTGVALGQIPDDDLAVQSSPPVAAVPPLKVGPGPEVVAPLGAGDNIEIGGPVVASPPIGAAPQPAIGDELKARPAVPVVFVEPVSDCELEALKKKIQEIAPGAILLRTGRFVALQAQSGNSIGPYAPSRYNLPPTCAGTLGARVEAANGQYALSSNHVMAHNGRAPLGTPVVVPATLDDPSGRNVLAQLAYYVDMQPAGWPAWSTTPTNEVDCALAAVTPPAALQAAIPVQPLAGASVAGIAVSKTGRTSGFTQGNVYVWNCAAYIDFDFTTCFFDNLCGTFGRKPFAAPGDSGALALTGPGNRGVGLVTARAYSFDPFGRFAGYFVVMCPLDSVAQRLADEMKLNKSDLKFFC